MPSTKETIHILYDFRTGPYGGGNQFLRALRFELEKNGWYSQTLRDATTILANTNPGSLIGLSRQLPELKKNHPNMSIILRVDGPITMIRGQHARSADTFTAALAAGYADGIIFQSNWSREKNREAFSTSAPHETVILNAPDPSIFYPPHNYSNLLPRPTRLIATSWSPHWRKGFELYKYLDKQLDFNRYEMTFIGNSPTKFKNIKAHPPVNPTRLAELLRSHHIYITGSMNDPCSNAVVEALACGLPIVAQNSGGHPELVGKGGILFNSPKEAIRAIETVAINRDTFRHRLPQHQLVTAARAYYGFTQSIRQKMQSGTYRPKEISSATKFRLLIKSATYQLAPLWYQHRLR